MRDPASDSARLVYWEHIGNRAVREGRWKLVAENRGPWELYDLESDPVELKDLSSRFPERAASLRSSYEAWAE